MQKELTRARIQALISSVFYRFGGVRSLQPLAQRQNVFQPGHDAFLLGKGRKGNWQKRNSVKTEAMLYTVLITIIKLLCIIRP